MSNGSVCADGWHAQVDKQYSNSEMTENEDKMSNGWVSGYFTARIWTLSPDKMSVDGVRAGVWHILVDEQHNYQQYGNGG